MGREAVLNFLSTDPDVSIGYLGIRFFKPGELDKKQFGYSRDEEGNSFVGSEVGDWKEEWLVIGEDKLIGDPVIVDTKSERLTVSSAFCGDNIWDPYLIADSFNNFIRIVEELKIISKNRENPEALGKNPFDLYECDRFLFHVIFCNPYTDIDYWKTFFEE